MTARATAGSRAPRRRSVAPIARRDRSATEARILGAVGSVLARDGFGTVGVNAIAREAGVDKVLIYRYWGGLAELLAAWSASGRFWPSVGELLQREPTLLSLPLADRYARFFGHFIRTLRERPLTLEILAAEIVERNELTAVLEAERERWGEEAARVLGGDVFVRRPELRALTILLVSGVQYLLVRSRKIRIFGGIDITADAGWAELEQAIAATARAMFDALPPVSPSVAEAPLARRRRKT